LLVSAVALLAMTGVGINAGVARAAKVEDEQRRTVDVDGQTRILIKNARGRTAVVGKDGARQVTILVTRYASARSNAKASELLKKITCEITTEGDEIIIETRIDDEADSGRSLWSVIMGGKKHAYIDYAIEVPDNFSVATVTTSGNVRVANISGAADIQATSGDVELREVGGIVAVALTSGTVHATNIGSNISIMASSGDATVEDVNGSFVMHATSGNVTARRIAGDVQIRLVNGDLILAGCLGDVDFATSSGSADIRDADGSIRAFTSSGDLDVMILPIGDREFNLSSSSGDIGVVYKALNEDYGFLLDVNTGSGSIEGDMPIKVYTISRSNLRGVVGSGQSRVIIETASGDVKIIEKTLSDKEKKSNKKSK